MIIAMTIVKIIMIFHSQGSVATSLSDKYRVQEEIEVEPEEVYQTMPPPPRPILPPNPVRYMTDP